MAKARAIVKRRRAVRNIRKITQTMQLIATARYQKCLQRAMAAKPYVAKLTEMIEALAGRESADHPLLVSNGQKRAILLVITSNRGLCGSYNATVLRLAAEHYRRQKAAGFDTALEMVGKKGLSYLRFLGHEPSEKITDVEDRIEYARVAAIAQRYVRLYESGEIGRVEVLYTRFVSTAQQRAELVQLVPIEPPAAVEGQPKAEPPDFEFSPSPVELLGRLIPEAVKIRLFQYFNESIVSEQAARMVAMKAATDASGEMIKFLTRRYNRARQTQITLELADIVGGAEAVK